MEPSLSPCPGSAGEKEKEAGKPTTKLCPCWCQPVWKLPWVPVAEEELG